MKRVASLYLPHWSIDRVRRAERPAASTRQPDSGSTAAGLLALKARADAEQGGKACDSPKNTGWRPGARWARDPDADALARPLAGVDEANGGAGACWAGETRADVERRIAAMPHHQRPPMREMGRRSEAAEMPFRRLGETGAESHAPDGWTEGGAGSFGGYLQQHPNGLLDRPSPFTGIDPNNDERARAAIARWKAPWTACLRQSLRTGMPSIRYPGEGPRPDKHLRRGSNDAGAAVPEVAAFFDTGRTTAGTLARTCPDERPASLPRTRDAAPPLVTVHKVASRVEIAAASPAALALGIEPGTALTQARASVPELAVRDADLAGDAADLRRLAVALARRWCPVVAISDADGLLLDITGTAHLHGGEERMAWRVVRLLARMGITARVAVADTAGAAWALARHGNAPVRLCPPDAHRAALAPLPVAALRLEGTSVELLRRLGIDTAGELAAMPRAPLVRRFGRAVARRLDQAAGVVDEPLDPVVPPEPIVVERRFAEPIATAEAIEHWLAPLAAELATALAKAGMGARALVFAATRVDGSVQSIRVGLARPSRDAAHILRLVSRRIEEVDPGYGIDALAFHVTRAEPLAPAAFGRDLGDHTPDLAPLVDTLANRVGARRLWRAAPAESDVPERAVALRPPIGVEEKAVAPLKPDDVRRLDASAPTDPWHPHWPRPVRLLRRPERIDHVLAEMPDFPPARFTWRGRTHRIVRGDGPERIFGEWWRRTAERHLVRDYFRVEDEAGHRFWLFRRGDGRLPETGDLSWYMHAALG